MTVDLSNQLLRFWADPVVSEESVARVINHSAKVSFVSPTTNFDVLEYVCKRANAVSRKHDPNLTFDGVTTYMARRLGSARRLIAGAMQSLSFDEETLPSMRVLVADLRTMSTYFDVEADRAQRTRDGIADQMKVIWDDIRDATIPGRYTVIQRHYDDIMKRRCLAAGRVCPEPRNGNVVSINNVILAKQIACDVQTYGLETLSLMWGTPQEQVDLKRLSDAQLFTQSNAILMNRVLASMAYKLEDIVGSPPKPRLEVVNLSSYRKRKQRRVSAQAPAAKVG